ncbi:hypothetical protein MesoLjLc_73210 [Mesorhizobium sp. L-8-10]|nr:hypothetical protein MesoLjLb_72180 [Mesorhizobium sp. L-8-3]BCH35391.1 hypothetical protein MesoLjLc_73210 [Mesorhizobium sp. L-8-10]
MSYSLRVVTLLRGGRAALMRIRIPATIRDRAASAVAGQSMSPESGYRFRDKDMRQIKDLQCVA